MTPIRDLLAHHAFFADLPEADLDLIAGCGRNAHFAANEAAFREGEPAQVFYVLRKGRMALETHAPPSGSVMVATLGPGEVVGWSWLFPPYNWHFDGLALEAVDAVAIDGACLRAKCDADPAFGYRLMKRFAEIAQSRLQAARMQLLDLYGECSEP